MSLKASSKQTEIPEVVDTGVIFLEDGGGVALVVEVVAGTSREREKPVLLCENRELKQRRRRRQRERHLKI